MNELDQESQEFIEWCQNKLIDDDWDNPSALVDEFFEATPVSVLIKKLKEKMVKGAGEHGPIDYNRDYDKEIENEILDLLGWHMMARWCKEHKKDKK